MIPWRRHWLLGLVSLVALAAVDGSVVRARAGIDPDTVVGRPIFSGDELLLPADYREWIFLSAGIGMTSDHSTGLRRPGLFTNVFVNPRAYQRFLETGKWPDQTLLVLELRGASSEGAVNTDGYYQTDTLATEVAVKAAERFGDDWGYFLFAGDDTSAPPLGREAGCRPCHALHAAVDSTFVQFYPTLRDAAVRSGTLGTSQPLPWGAGR